MVDVIDALKFRVALQHHGIEADFAAVQMVGAIVRGERVFLVADLEFPVEIGLTPIQTDNGTMVLGAVALLVGGAFALGYIVGKLVL